MTFPFARRLTFAFLVLSGACKTVPKAQPVETPAPRAAVATEEDEKPVIQPSDNLKNTSDLVTPGPDEALVRRGAGSRCPRTDEMKQVAEAVNDLGEETINLVKEDLITLRQTMDRKDRDGIGSCCNQLEQLVQDVEIMNDGKDKLKSKEASAMETIRRVTRDCCPPG